jgi:hypothetical protein
MADEKRFLVCSHFFCGFKMSVVQDILATLIEEITLEVVIEAHRKLVSGKLCLSCPSPSTDLFQTDGFDVIGSVRNATASAFLVCSNCGQRISSTRYAPHLEKCMGRGGRGSEKKTKKQKKTTENRVTKDLGAALNQQRRRRLFLLLLLLLLW